MRLLSKNDFQLIVFLFVSGACAIAEDYISVVLTAGTEDQRGSNGGWKSLDRVTRYFRDGTFEDLPNLLTERRGHTCGFYRNSNNEKVKYYARYISISRTCMLQVLLVTGGGTTGSNIDSLASTEILTPEASTWKYAGALPKAVYGLREDFKISRNHGFLIPLI